MEQKRGYGSMPSDAVGRRDFLKVLGVAAAGGAVLGTPPLYAEEPAKPPEIETNLADFVKVPRGPQAIPGPFPGRVAEASDPATLKGGIVQAAAVSALFAKGLKALTGKSAKKSFGLFFEKGDVVGIKVNPVGAPLINTTPELAQAVVSWLEEGGVPRANIVIWDRFATCSRRRASPPSASPACASRPSR